MDDNLDIREVPQEPDGSSGERLQEGVVEVAAVAAATFTGVQAAGSVAQAHYARLTHQLQADQDAREREEFQAEVERIRREFHEQMRMERLAAGGLDALDAYDDDFRGFGVE